MKNKDLKTCSKGNYGLPHEGNPTLEDIRTSALMRIADATETIASDYAKLRKDLEYFANGYKKRGVEISELERRNAALRGVITRLKNKYEK